MDRIVCGAFAVAVVAALAGASWTTLQTMGDLKVGTLLDR